MRLLLVLLVLIAAWAAGFMAYVSTVPAGVPEPDRRTDAIVVLTGGGSRLAVGFDLLDRGLAPVLFVSGVDRRNDEAELRRQANRPGKPGVCCVVIGYAARDTLGNGFEVAEWARTRQVHSIRLVTADYHMPRALWLVHRALPGVEIVAHPVFPDGVRRERWWEGEETTRLLLFEYHKYLAQRIVAVVSDVTSGGRSRIPEEAAPARESQARAR